jgi:hypothetical protein
LKKFFLLGIGVTLIPAFLGMISSKTKPKPVVLAQKVEATLVSTIMPTSTPSVTTTPIPIQTIKPTPTPKPIPTVPPVTSQEINGFIESFAGQYATDPNVLRHIAICESGFNPNAVNGPYVGLYQFGPVTWQNTRKLIGENSNINLRFDAKTSVQTAAYLLASRGRSFWPNCKP